MASPLRDKALAPEFEKKTGDKLLTEWGPSMGDTPQAVPVRLESGEPIDVLIMVGYALGDLVRRAEGQKGISSSRSARPGGGGRAFAGSGMFVGFMSQTQLCPCTLVRSSQ